MYVNTCCRNKIKQIKQKQKKIKTIKKKCGLQEINSREILLHLTFSANWNKRDIFKYEKARIHVKSEVFAAFAIVDAKAPFLLYSVHF